MVSRPPPKRPRKTDIQSATPDETEAFVFEDLAEAEDPLPPPKVRRGPAPDGEEALFCKISNFDLANLFLQIFGGLGLGCIKTKFCKKICV